MTCTVEITLHALSQRSPARSGIENSWPKGKAKVKGRSPYKQHALKGQKLLAQGNALGIKAISKAPCKGKSFKTTGNL